MSLKLSIATKKSPDNRQLEARLAGRWGPVWVQEWLNLQNWGLVGGGGKLRVQTTPPKPPAAGAAFGAGPRGREASVHGFCPPGRTRLPGPGRDWRRLSVPSGMSVLQPAGLNEKQAGRPRPATRAVWAGPLGRAVLEDTLSVPGMRGLGVGA